MQIVWRSLLAALLAAALSACILASGIDSFKKLGVTDSDRATLLSDQLKAFHEALLWGKTDEALLYCSEESRPQMLAALRKNGSQEKIVESKVEHVEFLPGMSEADVETVVKYYEIPLYVVRERREQEKWKFSLGDGWQILSKSVSG